MTKTQQVAYAMRRLIGEGFWKVGESVGDLGKLERESDSIFGVKASFGTIRAAEQILVDEGLLSPIRPGMPTRVVAVPATTTGQVLSLEQMRVVHTRLGEVYAMLGKIIAAAS